MPPPFFDACCVFHLGRENRLASLLVYMLIAPLYQNLLYFHHRTDRVLYTLPAGSDFNSLMRSGTMGPLADLSLSCSNFFVELPPPTPKFTSQILMEITLATDWFLRRRKLTLLGAAKVKQYVLTNLLEKIPFPNHPYLCLSRESVVYFPEQNDHMCILE